MDFASLRASKARYTLVLSLLSGLSFLQHASFAAAASRCERASLRRRKRFAPETPSTSITPLQSQIQVQVRGQATPMTYRFLSRPPGDALMAFALPD